METKEDRDAIMRWETETGPTAGKNKRPVKGAKSQNAAGPGTSIVKRGIAQGKLQKTPIASVAVTGNDAVPAQDKTASRAGKASTQSRSASIPAVPKKPQGLPTKTAKPSRT